MNDNPPTLSIAEHVQAMGPGPLNEENLKRYIHPLFKQTLQHRTDIYLANHSLGRPLDQTQYDVGAAMQLWYANMNDAWDTWLREQDAFRARIGQLINAQSGDCIIPKASAGQGLRTVLNAFDEPLEVICSADEFDSIDVILKTYVQHRRIQLTQVQPNATGLYAPEAFLQAIHGPALLVVSPVLFNTGQYQLVQPLIDAAHAQGALVLLDLYHTAGAIPVDMRACDADFAIGGCYKYLRGGPGAGWLYLHPRHLTGAFRSLDVGWFALHRPFAFERQAQPQFAAGGDAFLESTPAVLPWYQAKAGLQLTLQIGVARVREYALAQQQFLLEQLTQYGVTQPSIPPPRGAFLAIFHEHAHTLSQHLTQENVTTDARGHYLRLCPDILTSKQALMQAAQRIAACIKAL